MGICRYMQFFCSFGFHNLLNAHWYWKPQHHCLSLRRDWWPLVCGTVALRQVCRWPYPSRLTQGLWHHMKTLCLAFSFLTSVRSRRSLSRGVVCGCWKEHWVNHIQINKKNRERAKSRVFTWSREMPCGYIHTQPDTCSENFPGRNLESLWFLVFSSSCILLSGVIMIVQRNAFL